MGSEQLYVDVEARLTDLEKGMKRAQAIANKAYAGMKRDSHDAAQAMERDMAGSINRVGSMMKNLGKGFLGGLVAGGVGELINQVGQVAKGIAAIGDEAKRAGVSAKAFQEWKYVAEQNRIPVDAMVDALKELNLRADEFVVTGKGPAAEAFGRLGISAEQLREKLKQPDKLLLEIIGKVQTLDKAAQIRVFDEIFGGQGGERMVELIAQGEQGIRNTIAAAHDLNIVMDDKLIAKAAELDRKFNAITVTVGTALKTAIVEAAGALQSFIDEFRGFEFARDVQPRGSAANADDAAWSVGKTERHAGRQRTGADRQGRRNRAEGDRYRTCHHRRRAAQARLAAAASGIVVATAPPR